MIGMSPCRAAILLALPALALLPCASPLLAEGTDAAAGAAAGAAACDSGIAFVVRHGEKNMTGDAEKDRDAPLSAEGLERARALAATLADAGVDAIYSSPYKRTQGTAQPLADHLKLTVATVSVAEKDAQAAIATKVMAENCGREALVVGHSNTVPDLLRAFGATGVREIEDSQYDNLYVVRWRKGAATELLILHYGRPTP